jgi:hypothetical protein
VVRRLASENPDWLAVYLELIRKLRTHPDLQEQWSKRSPELNVAMKEHIEELQREGELRQDLSALELGRFMGLLLDGIAVQVSAGYPVEVEPLLRLVSAAIAPQ